MPQSTITFTYSVQALEALSPTQQALCQMARDATTRAYAPYSRFRVGCAAEVEGVRELIEAANLENAAYPQCICAEAGLLARIHAQYPRRPIRRIAIAVDGDGASVEGAAPCGSCRQQLYEAEARQGGRPIALLLVGADDTVRLIDSCSDLLPLGFSL